jgi:hypothetical protein
VFAYAISSLHEPASAAKPPVPWGSVVRNAAVGDLGRRDCIRWDFWRLVVRARIRSADSRGSDAWPTWVLGRRGKVRARCEALGILRDWNFSFAGLALSVFRLLYTGSRGDVVRLLRGWVTVWLLQ